MNPGQRASVGSDWPSYQNAPSSVTDPSLYHDPYNQTHNGLRNYGSNTNSLRSRRVSRGPTAIPLTIGRPSSHLYTTSLEVRDDYQRCLERSINYKNRRNALIALIAAYTGGLALEEARDFNEELNLFAKAILQQAIVADPRSQVSPNSTEVPRLNVQSDATGSEYIDYSNGMPASLHLGTTQQNPFVPDPQAYDPTLQVYPNLPTVAEFDSNAGMAAGSQFSAVPTSPSNLDLAGFNLRSPSNDVGFARPRASDGFMDRLGATVVPTYDPALGNSTAPSTPVRVATRGADTNPRKRPKLAQAVSADGRAAHQPSSAKSKRQGRGRWEKAGDEGNYLTIRKMKACDRCFMKKKRCDPSHKGRRNFSHKAWSKDLDYEDDAGPEMRSNPD